MVKFFKCITLIALFAFPLIGASQAKTEKLQQFNNFTANFEVPEGKTWVVNQIFSSFAAGVETLADGSTSITPVRIFIKTFNGDIKTDWQGNRFGPQVFQSNSTYSSIPFPLTLPEKTKISFVIVQGDPGKCKAFDGSGYITYTELTNEK